MCINPILMCTSKKYHALQGDENSCGSRLPPTQCTGQKFRVFTSLGQNIPHCSFLQFTTTIAHPPTYTRPTTYIQDGSRRPEEVCCDTNRLSTAPGLLWLILTYSKRKWAKDPNNTAWSRNTDTFGQKILRSQGWAPGQYLGAQDASHSEFYTAANASHIRAVLKDDNMGLGAKRNQGDECTGLDALQELLGRLNGKSQESLDEDKKKREDVRINKYLARKLGTIRFVYGGLLVGDKVQELADELKKEKEAAAASKSAESAESSEATDGKKEKKSKKRKAEDDTDGTSEKKKSKKSKKQDSDEAEDDSKARRKERKEKKKKREKSSTDEDDNKADDDDDDDATTRKKSKKDKKEKRKKSKDGEGADAGDISDSQLKKKKKRKAAKEETAAEASKTASLPTASSTPTTSGVSTPVEGVPFRHLSRKRFIAQKRAAVMDQAALNQVRPNTSRI